MRGAELVALARAHGIDLTQVECNGAAAPRAIKELLDGCEMLPSTRGRSRRPERSEEARGYEGLPWLAARYSLANDETCYWPLWNGLVFQAQRLGSRDGWPPQVRGVRGEPRFYLLELATLVLDEIACPQAFAAAPELRAIYLGVEDEAWACVLEPHYRSLQAIYARWLGTARGQIRGWINGESVLETGP
jgi:hypothetical protein